MSRVTLADAERGYCYRLGIFGLSIVVAMVVAYTALKLAARVAEAGPSGGRLWLLGGAVAMGAGICAMHYSGMGAIQIVPIITYQPMLVLASIGIAVGAS